MEKNEELFKKMRDLVFDLSNEESDFNFFVMQNEELLLKIDPILYIGLKVDYYLQRDEIEKGLSVVYAFKSGKYISMEVEDFLEDLKNQILKDGNAVEKVIDDEKIEEDLFSNNEQKVVNIIRILSNRNLRKYLDLLDRYLKTFKNEKMHKLILILMVEQHIDEEFSFYFEGEVKRIIPSSLKLPFENNEYRIMCAYIASKNKNPSDIKNIKDIYSYILVQAFPIYPFEKLNIAEIYDILHIFDMEMKGIEIDIDDNLIDEYRKLKNYLQR